MEKQKQIFQLLLRLTLSASYLSAVADRFGFWGAPGTPGVSWGNWENFINYSNGVNSFVPKEFGSALGIVATAFEILIPIFLIAGYKLKQASMLSGLLLSGFGLAMTVSFGVKPPLDYSVFTCAAASFILSTIPGGYGLDGHLGKK